MRRKHYLYLIERRDPQTGYLRHIWAHSPCKGWRTVKRELQH